MRTEYAIGKLRIPFASQVRRRWLVIVVYASMALMLMARFTSIGVNFGSSIGWIIGGSLALFVGLMIVFTWLVGDIRIPGDERESYRRDHAHYVAYNSLRPILAVLFFASLWSRDPRSSPKPPLHGLFIEFPTILLWAVVIVYFTLPQAILLWTEPDMVEPNEN